MSSPYNQNDTMNRDEDDIKRQGFGGFRTPLEQPKFDKYDFNMDAPIMVQLSDAPTPSDMEGNTSMFENVGREKSPDALEDMFEIARRIWKTFNFKPGTPEFNSLFSEAMILYRQANDLE